MQCRFSFSKTRPSVLFRSSNFIIGHKSENEKEAGYVVGIVIQLRNYDTNSRLHCDAGDDALSPPTGINVLNCY